MPGEKRPPAWLCLKKFLCMRPSKDTILKWWRKEPRANVGIALGAVSGVIVLDVDGPEAEDLLLELVGDQGLPETLCHRTPAGGRHYFFSVPPGFDKTKRRFNSADGGSHVILMGKGCQVVMPPSIHPNGKTYEAPAEEVAVAAAPQHILDLFDQRERPGPQEVVPDVLPRPAPEGWRRDQGRPGGEERARRYARKCAEQVPAIQGQNGSARLMWVARALAWGFDLGPEKAIAIIQDEYNPSCLPPWSEKELRHKCQDADTKPFSKPRGWLLEVDNPKAPDPLPRRPRAEQSRPDGCESFDAEAHEPKEPAAAESDSDDRSAEAQTFCNYRLVDVQEGDREKAVKVGLPADQLARDLLTLTGGWPKRTGSLLFVNGTNYSPLWLATADALFAWIQTLLPGRDTNAVLWASGHDKLTRAEFFAYLQQQAEGFEAVEAFPHWPARPRTYYMHPPVRGGDGAALLRLLRQFKPASLVDGDLVLALLLSLLWGGEPGQRPAWLVTGEDGDAKGGRGIGKSKLFQLFAQLVGGYIAADSNEPFHTLTTRLLSGEAIGKRVVLMDNVKTHRFSWAELEAAITSKWISGKRLYAGEGQRPNTLIYGITLNGASLSKDLAQRCMIVRLARPQWGGRWEEETTALVESLRWEIIGDALAILQGNAPTLAGHSRWGAWEREVLAHVGDPAECQKVTEERQGDVDGDEAEADMVREAFRREILDRGLSAEAGCIWMPTALVAEIVNRATGDTMRPNKATAYLRTLAISQLRRSNRGDKGRGWLWTGLNASTAPVVNLG
jgi:hypothetical protein